MFGARAKPRAAQAECALHAQVLGDASAALSAEFDAEMAAKVDADRRRWLDQAAYRFNELQDSLGEKVLARVHQVVQHDSQGNARAHDVDRSMQDSWISGDVRLPVPGSLGFGLSDQFARAPSAWTGGKRQPGPRSPRAMRILKAAATRLRRGQREDRQ